MNNEAGLTRTDLLAISGIMIVLVALVTILAPKPVVHVEIKEVKVTVPAGSPESIRIAPKSLVIAPEVLEISPKSIKFAPGNVTIEEPELRVPDAPWPERVSGFEADKVDCMNNMRQLVTLLEITPMNRYPIMSGPNLILYLVKKGELQGEDSIKLLFCPGDKNESFRLTGGVGAYRDIDLKKRGEYGSLTSYAGRDQLNAACAAKKGAARPVVLVCDDSEDHHENRGMVVGLTGGAVKWRDKLRDYGIRGKRITVGEGSVVEELKCLRAD